MDNIALLIVAALGLGILGWQARRLSRASAARRAARAGFLDACATLLSDSRRRVEPDGFPRVAGASGGARFDLRVVPDTLTTRNGKAMASPGVRVPRGGAAAPRRARA